ncbi:DUF4139 domain-containing protein [Aurantiacibacter poecillastricola]|uniref:DUF4139 domain-containing protein n=1 Tax=Aurantiacibacter poecillastricola TaxID=3064385 RepID=UPI00273D5377|nr:hypothetical protein [Aurantiacibacter sp. 219JJ12-13]MDP5261701.1 hypothetical protein [Aurantiacibacter sp. 219JJ12-13]
MARSALLVLPLLALASPLVAQDRAVVRASEPQSLAVTVYRDPNRSTGQSMNTDWPQGFAMISETRRVTLPPGESRIRFEGVAEGMVAVSAIVTGLPGGTIEKNRNADLLSPAALVDGSLGNRVRITRTNPATGEEQSESAIVRTRADGGLVLQTQDGYEAVRCSGLPERLTFDSMPDGLSSEPIFSIDTADETGGTYTVTLTYLAWGFDWEASYVATLHEGREADDVRFDLTSWLTILNDNGQSFADAELMAVAGTLNVTSDFEELSDPPQARPLRLTCYPLGDTAAGLSYPFPPPPPPPPPPAAPQMIVVTGSRVSDAMMESVAPMAVMAGEEQLGDLKLYRVPVPVDVNAQGLKQVAFLREEGVEGELTYEGICRPWDSDERFLPTRILLETVNDEDHGLGVALPSGSVSVFERSPAGELLVAEESLRDYAAGQDVELDLGESAQVFMRCDVEREPSEVEGRRRWWDMVAELTNANPFPVTVRLEIGAPSQWIIDGTREVIRNGQRVIEVDLPGNGSRELQWRVREINS